MLQNYLITALESLIRTNRVKNLFLTKFSFFTLRIIHTNKNLLHTLVVVITVLLSFNTIVAQNNALNFDGTNDALLVRGGFSQLDISGTELTIEAWIYPTGSLGSGSFEKTIVSKEDDPAGETGYFLRHGGGKFDFGFGNFAKTGSTSNFVQPGAPLVVPGVVQTGDPIVVADEIAIVGGKVNPEGVNATISIEYGTTQSLGSTVNAIPATSSANADVAISAQLPSLSPGTTYYYRVKSTNAQGDVLGQIKSFTTLAADFDKRWCAQWA